MLKRKLMVMPSKGEILLERIQENQTHGLELKKIIELDKLYLK